MYVQYVFGHAILLQLLGAVSPGTWNESRPFAERFEMIADVRPHCQRTQMHVTVINKASDWRFGSCIMMMMVR